VVVLFEVVELGECCFDVVFVLFELGLMVVDLVE